MSPELLAARYQAEVIRWGAEAQRHRDNLKELAAQFLSAHENEHLHVNCLISGSELEGSVMMTRLARSPLDTGFLSIYYHRAEAFYREIMKNSVCCPVVERLSERDVEKIFDKDFFRYLTRL